MKNALAEKVAVPDTALPVEKPRAHVTEVTALTSQGNGLKLWGHVTPYTLANVLDAEYFQNCLEVRGGGLFRHDRIIITASAETDSPEHVTLVVTEVTKGNVAVKALDRG